MFLGRKMILLSFIRRDKIYNVENVSKNSELSIFVTAIISKTYYPNCYFLIAIVTEEIPCSS